MSKINDGGPAFPETFRREEKYMDAGGYGHTRIVTDHQKGMSLRDYLAGQALACPAVATVSKYCNDADAPISVGVATMAYRIADAMIAARGEQ